MSRYLKPIRNLGGVALILIIIGLIFPQLAQTITDERVRTGILVQAIPFVAFFVAILLIFILLIVLAAMRFNGKLPSRAYRPIELTIIVGILGGVVALFQPFAFPAYKYGFVMLLGATLCFILWSHVVPRSAKADLQLPKLTPAAQIIGAVAGLLVVVILVVSAVSANAPQAPYGERQRVWNSYSPERQAEIAAERTAEFNNVEVPILILMNVLPGLLVFFAVRELAASMMGVREPNPTSASSASRTLTGTA